MFSLEIKLFVTIFVVVFLAELGDKTQLATMLFAADAQVSKWLVFFAAATALVLSTALGVLLGGLVAEYVSASQLKYMAGAGFILIGLWTLLS